VGIKPLFYSCQTNAYPQTPFGTIVWGARKLLNSSQFSTNLRAAGLTLGRYMTADEVPETDSSTSPFDFENEEQKLRELYADASDIGRTDKRGARAPALVAHVGDP
jgi:hypothetical protein